MPVVQPLERLLDTGVYGKFGRAFNFGRKVFGEGLFGETELELELNGLGDLVLGVSLYGVNNIRWGIYQRRHNKGKVVYVRESFYRPSNPRTVKQQNWRAVFTAGMVAWKNLTDEQKKVYNKRGHTLKICGVNLFLRNWLKSH